MPLISLNIEQDVKKKVQLLGLRHAGVYMRGYNDIVNESSYERAIEDMRKKMERMAHLLDHYIVKTVQQEDKIKELETCGHGSKKNVNVKKK